MNHHADMNRDLEQQAIEALEDFRQGVADQEQIKLLAYLTCVDDRIVARVNAGHSKAD